MKVFCSICVLSLLLSVARAEAKISCEIFAKPVSISFTKYRASLFERFSNRWRGNLTVEQFTDLTGKLDNAALNRIDQVEITFLGRGDSDGADAVRVYTPDSLKVRDGQIILLQPRLDTVIGRVDSPSIRSIRGVRFKNPVRDEFESLPLLESSRLSVGDHVALLFHRSLPRDPEFRLRLVPDREYLTGQVLSITQGSTSPHVLLVDRQRRLFRFPLESVAEFRQPEIVETHPDIVAEQTFRSFGDSWGTNRGKPRFLQGDHGLNALRFYHGRTNAVLLVRPFPRMGTSVIAINPVDRMDIVFGPDSMRLPWLDLTIPYSSIDSYADDNNN